MTGPQSSCAMKHSRPTTRSGTYPIRHWTASGISSLEPDSGAGIGLSSNPRSLCEDEHDRDLPLRQATTLC
jgi:hypothetical protein